MKSLQHHLRNTFLAGVFAAIPLAATGLVIWYVEKQTRALSLGIPFLGIIVALLSVYLLGLIVTSLLGKWLLVRLDRLLSRMPLLRDLYSAWKQIALNPPGTMGMFSQVVLLSDESGNRKTLAFTSGQPIPSDPATACVFVPAAPNPTSGRLYFVPLSQCQPANISPKDAFKMILSGGNYIPDQIGSITSTPPRPSPTPL